MADFLPIDNTTRRSFVGGLAPTRNKKIAKTDFKETLDKATQSASLKDIKEGKPPPSASEIRYDLVNKFRNDLKSGVYEVKSNEIADKIVQKIREEKDQIIL